MNLDELREFLVAEKETDDFFPVRDARFIAAIALVDKLRQQQPEGYLCFWKTGYGVDGRVDFYLRSPAPAASCYSECRALYALPVLPKEEAPENVARDAKAWRELAAVLRAASMPDALRIEMSTLVDGVLWQVRKVLSTRELGLGTVLGVKAAGMAAEQMAHELDAAMQKGGA